MDSSYPPLVTSLPLADVPLPGVDGWLLQGDSRQVVFFRLAPGTVIPEHHHGAQWGLVVDGELDLTIGGVTRTYRKGDCYEIGAAVPHSATCPRGALAIDVFADAARYRARP